MRGKCILLAALIIAALLGMTACQSDADLNDGGKKSIVVTYSVLGSIVKELVGDRATVTVSGPV
ncbi:MAG: hypothetical protein NTU41_04330 [Chloroflexi bacterium]|nr:hypothetical protein [Chloroflexota bacterium]